MFKLLDALFSLIFALGSLVLGFISLLAIGMAMVFVLGIIGSVLLVFVAFAILMLGVM